MAKPLNDEDRQQIKTLHTQGLSRNQIAKATGRSPGTITNVCNQQGLTFDRTNTQNATKARMIDNKAVRIGLASESLQAARDLNKAIQDRISGGLHDESFRDIATVYGILVDKHTVLEKMDHTVENHSDVDSWLEHLVGDAE